MYRIRYGLVEVKAIKIYGKSALRKGIKDRTVERMFVLVASNMTKVVL
jgi:hypothetical protein